MGMESLQALCLHLVVEKIDRLVSKDATGQCQLQKGVYLPSQVCDAILQQRRMYGLDHSFLSIFQDTSSTRLDCVDFSYMPQFTVITPELFIVCDDSYCHPLAKDLINIISHDLSELNLLGIRLTRSVVEALQKHCHRLKSLQLKASSFNCPCNKLDPTEDCCLEDLQMDLKQLQRLSLHEISSLDSHYVQSFNVAVKIMMSARNLAVLDLAKSLLITLDFLTPQQFPNLHTLLLFEVRIRQVGSTRIPHTWMDEESPLAAAEFNTISKLTNLRCLDVSRICEYTADAQVSSDTQEAFENMISCLNKLEWLDICGTAFAGTPTAEAPISWLAGRRLTFLGLLDCKSAPVPCKRPNLPADNVAGNKNLEQILTCLQTYSTRAWVPHVFEPLKSLIYQLLPSSGQQHYSKSALLRALKVVIEVMEHNLYEGQILAAGCQCLTVLIGSVGLNIDVLTKRKIIRLMVAIIHLRNNIELFRCAGDVLDRFKSLHTDGLFIFERLAAALMKVLRLAVSRRHMYDWLDYSYIMSQFESFAHPVEPQYKHIVGQLGAIKLLNQVISLELRRMGEEHQTSLSIAWQLLYSLTDETPDNGRLFVQENGIPLFEACYRLRKSEHILVDMMGLMGNMAEVADLRPKIMNSDVMDILIACASRGDFEKKNAVCCALCHLLADGESNWTYRTHSFEKVDKMVEEEVCKWNEKRLRSIEYRSLVPLVRLVQCSSCPGVQTYGTWELLNITCGKPLKYMQMLERDGLLEAMSYLAKLDDPQNKACSFSQMVLALHSQYSELSHKSFKKVRLLDADLGLGENDDSDYCPDSEDMDADGEDDDVDNQHEALIDLLEGNLVQQAIQQLVNISPSDFFDEEIYLDDPMEVVIPDVATLLQQQQQLSHLHEAETEFEDSTDSEMTNDDDTDNEDDDNVGFLFPIPVMDDDDPDYIP